MMETMNAKEFKTMVQETLCNGIDSVVDMMSRNHESANDKRLGVTEAKDFAAKLQELLGDSYEVVVDMVTRNNETAAGIMIKNKEENRIGDNVEYCPIYYPEKGISPEEVAKSFTSMPASTWKKLNAALECLKNPCKRNKALWLGFSSDPDYAKLFVHRKIEDIFIIPCVLLEDIDGCAAKCNFPINYAQSILTSLITEDDLFNIAMKNVEQKAVIMDMNELMQQIFSESLHINTRQPANLLDDEARDIDKSMPMVVITTESHIYGSAAIMSPSVQKWLLKHMDGKCYILPSSIHEMIAVPYDDGVSPEELKEMISDINDNVVESIDQLSNNAYILSEEGLKFA